MMDLKITRRLSVLVLGGGLCSSVLAADIYRSATANGDVRYASQAIDASYVLYLRDEPNDVTAKADLGGSHQRQSPYHALIESLARKHAVDAALVRAIIEVESHFNPKAVSIKGAVGLMQLMPATMARYGVTDRHDIGQNLEAGIRCLKDLLVQHNGNVALALASYNAGPRAIARHGSRIPPYRETMLYVPAVLARLQAARGIDAE